MTYRVTLRGSHTSSEASGVLRLIVNILCRPHRLLLLLPFPLLSSLSFCCCSHSFFLLFLPPTAALLFFLPPTAAALFSSLHITTAPSPGLIPPILFPLFFSPFALSFFSIFSSSSSFSSFHCSS